MVDVLRDLLIRSAERSDVEELVRLRLLFQRHMERPNPRVWRITKEGEAHLREETEEMLAKEDGRMLVAVKDGVIVGFIYGEFSHRTTYTPNNIGRISILYVREEFRRRGIGKRLVEELCRFFASKNVEEVTLNYIIGNEEAEGFWGALGFKSVRIGANIRFERLMEYLSSIDSQS
ncbi:GNAT family N-acetyltransferase [Candidatus Bathyarchaeota archaeon]|nr:MAG: GNAT family N-acetyltransferase [Candidatus Bathyarchaeota archaeon]